MLDISAQETMDNERLPFRRTLAPGARIEVPDQYRSLKNIDSAIAAGFLAVVSYDSSAGSLVVNAELAGIGSGTWKEDFFTAADSQTDFALSLPPTSPSSIILFYGGLVQNRSMWSIIGGITIRLGFPASEGIQVVVRYQ